MSLKTLPSVPKVAGVIPRAFLTLLKKPGTTLPDLGFRIHGVGIDAGSYNSFCRLFGFSEDLVPLTYWHIRFFGLRAFLASRTEAPFPLPGMVHLSDRIRQYRPIHPEESFTVDCRFGRLLAHEKGTAFETLTRLFSGENLVWEENTVNLYLGKNIPCQEETGSFPIELSQNCHTVTAEMHSGMGREYAKVSGDYNPIHLNTMGARVFGFKRHLLHGWYSVNRCLQPYEKELKGTAELVASFKKPLFLPSKINLKTERATGEILFEAADFKEKFPHVKGMLKPQLN
jgi:hypothetical protein